MLKLALDALTDVPVLLEQVTEPDPVVQPAQATLEKTQNKRRIKKVRRLPGALRGTIFNLFECKLSN